MPMAELHGKISSSGTNLNDRLEDQLTSDVFGRMRYLKDDWLLLRMLQRALRVDTGTDGLVPYIAQLVQGAKPIPPVLDFWPRLTDCEPDVLASWHLHGCRVVLMFEVKFLSGKSGEGFVNEDPDVGAVPAVSDQLGREYQDLCSLLQAVDKGALIYLTAHTSIPRQSLEESLKTVSTKPDVGLYWLSWSGVYRLLRQLSPEDRHQSLVVGDIIALLERKGLSGIRPWSEVLGDFATDELDVKWYRLQRSESRYNWPITAPEFGVYQYRSTGRAYYWPTELAAQSTVYRYRSSEPT